MFFYIVKYVSLLELFIEIIIDLSFFFMYNKIYYLKFKYILYLL